MLTKLKPTIAVIDSGLGGVSVLNQLIAKYGCGNYIYFADNLFMPYGNKTAKFIEKRVEEIINKLNKDYQPDYIIIACNTASSVVNKAKFDNVLTISFNKSTPILATKLTVNQLAGFDAIADKNLASLIEKDINNQTKLNQDIKRHANAHNLQQYKVLTLGCTHYELVKDLFQKYCPNTTFILNSASLIDNLNFDPLQEYLTIKVLLSKQDANYEQTIIKLATKPLN